MTRVRETELQSAEIESPLQEERFGHDGRNKNVAKTTVVVLGAIGILAMPVGYFLSVTENSLTDLAISTNAAPRLPTAEDAVLAVDTLGLKIQTKNATVSAQERLESVTVKHLARLHRTYSHWAQRDQELMGSLHLKLNVDAAGRVVKIEPVASYLTNSDFSKVVLAEVRNWKFSEAITSEAAEITIPLLFVPKGMDPNTAVQWERNLRRAEGTATTSLRAANHLSSAVGGETPTPAPIPPHRRKANPASSAPHQKPKAEQKPETEKDVPVAFKTNQAITLREKPRFSSKGVHEIDGETQLAVLESKGDWLKVKLADADSVGFVRKEFVIPIN
jgi:outer membrane biosynthesis protein TonB